MTRLESIALARIKMSNVTDWNVQLAYLVEVGEWDRAAVVLASMAQDVQVLAGHVSTILPAESSMKLKCQREKAALRAREDV